MELYDNNLYIEDLKKVAELNVPWNTIKDSSILISGASGMIGSFFVDVIMYKNFTVNLNCKIYALGRNLEKLERRFLRYLQDENFYIIQHDINEPLVLKQIEKIDYIFHLASNTHPLQYSGDPIGTICTNILGLKNMLDLAVLHNAKRFIFASSNEIYGENRGDIE